MKLNSTTVVEHRDGSSQAAMKSASGGPQDVVVPGACSSCCGAIVRR